MAGNLLSLLTQEACITTTAEEVAWFLEFADEQGRVMEPAEDLIETAVVGDPVGFLLLR